MTPIMEVYATYYFPKHWRSVPSLVWLSKRWAYVPNLHTVEIGESWQCWAQIIFSQDQEPETIQE